MHRYNSFIVLNLYPVSIVTYKLIVLSDEIDMIELIHLLSFLYSYAIIII